MSDFIRDWWAKHQAAEQEREREIEARLDSKRAAAARSTRSKATSDHERRAKALSDSGHSAAQIGMILAREDGRAESPYDSRQVRRWLAKTRTG